MPRKSGTSNQQLPILPVRRQTSTFGVYVLNCCVRYGNRWCHIAIVTECRVLRTQNYTEETHAKGHLGIPQQVKPSTD